VFPVFETKRTAGLVSEVIKRVGLITACLDQSTATRSDSVSAADLHRAQQQGQSPLVVNACFPFLSATQFSIRKRRAFIGLTTPAVVDFLLLTSCAVCCASFLFLSAVRFCRITLERLRGFMRQIEESIDVAAAATSEARRETRMVLALIKTLRRDRSRDRRSAPLPLEHDDQSVWSRLQWTVTPAATSKRTTSTSFPAAAVRAGIQPRNQSAPGDSSDEHRCDETEVARRRHLLELFRHYLLL
jgi:hypothetical protein